MANQTNHSKFNTGPDFDSVALSQLNSELQLKLSSLGKGNRYRSEPLSHWATELLKPTEPPNPPNPPMSHRSLPKFDFFLLLCARFCAPSNAGDSLSDYYQIALAHFWLSSSGGLGGARPKPSGVALKGSANLTQFSRRMTPMSTAPVREISQNDGSC